jgi:hypothetical protein
MTGRKVLDPNARIGAGAAVAVSGLVIPFSKVVPGTFGFCRNEVRPLSNPSPIHTCLVQMEDNEGHA